MCFLGVEIFGAKGTNPKGCDILDCICIFNTSCGSRLPSKPKPLPKLSNLILKSVKYQKGSPLLYYIKKHGLQSLWKRSGIYKAVLKSSLIGTDRNFNQSKHGFHSIVT